MSSLLNVRQNSPLLELSGEYFQIQKSTAVYGQGCLHFWPYSTFLVYSRAVFAIWDERWFVESWADVFSISNPPSPDSYDIPAGLRWPAPHLCVVLADWGWKKRRLKSRWYLQSQTISRCWPHRRSLLCWIIHTDAPARPCLSVLLSSLYLSVMHFIVFSPTIPCPLSPLPMYFDLTLSIIICVERRTMKWFLRLESLMCGKQHRLTTALNTGWWNNMKPTVPHLHSLELTV